MATSASLKAQEAEHATALLSGSLAFCSWVELRVSAAKLRDADRLRYERKGAHRVPAKHSQIPDYGVACGLAPCKMGTQAFCSCLLQGLMPCGLSRCNAVLVLLCSKSDPMAVLFEDKEGRWVEAGRTEMIANNLSESGCGPGTMPGTAVTASCGLRCQTRYGV